MPLTDEEQKVFNSMLDGAYIDEPDDKIFLRGLQKVLDELADNVILKMRIDNIVEKLKGKENE